MTDLILQGTDAWKQQRLGKVTASRVADIMRRVRGGGPSAMRANYMAELIAERLTGVPAESFTSGPMQWGKDKEQFARAEYEFYRGVEIELVGFIDHPSISFAGASPDGFVGSDGLVEFKAPNTATHLETLLGAPINPDYVKQIQWQIACSRRAWGDWVSFDLRVPVEMQIHIRKLPRDDVLIREMETEVTSFNAELADKLGELKLLYGMTEAA